MPEFNSQSTIGHQSLVEYWCEFYEDFSREQLKGMIKRNKGVDKNIHFKRQESIMLFFIKQKQ